MGSTFEAHIVHILPSVMLSSFSQPIIFLPRVVLLLTLSFSECPSQPLLPDKILIILEGSGSHLTNVEDSAATAFPPLLIFGSNWWLETFFIVLRGGQGLLMASGE